MADVPLYSYVEDEPSKAVAERMVDHVNAIGTSRLSFREGFPSIKHGFGSIKKMMPSLVQLASDGLSSFVITDLDKGECAPSLVRNWMGKPRGGIVSPPSGLVFRVAVREVESWIMADRNAFSGFMQIPLSNFPKRPDELEDPKQRLLSIIRKKGRKKWQRDMLPKGPSASIGPIYNEKLCQFVTQHWQPERARNQSPSLAKALDALRSVTDD